MNFKMCSLAVLALTMPILAMDDEETNENFTALLQSGWHPGFGIFEAIRQSIEEDNRYPLAQPRVQEIAHEVQTILGIPPHLQHAVRILPLSGTMVSTNTVTGSWFVDETFQNAPVGLLRTRLMCHAQFARQWLAACNRRECGGLSCAASIGANTVLQHIIPESIERYCLGLMSVGIATLYTNVLWPMRPIDPHYPNVSAEAVDQMMKHIGCWACLNTLSETFAHNAQENAFIRPQFEQYFREQKLCSYHAPIFQRAYDAVARQHNQLAEETTPR